MIRNRKANQNPTDQSLFGEQTSPHAASFSDSSKPKATRAVAAVTPLFTAAVTATNIASLLNTVSCADLAAAGHRYSQPNKVLFPLAEQVRAMGCLNVVYYQCVFVCHVI